MALLWFCENSLNTKLEKEEILLHDTITENARQYKSSVAHKTDKWTFDRNIIWENKSPSQPNSEIHRLPDLLEE